jgi:hypothetical protein
MRLHSDVVDQGRIPFADVLANLIHDFFRNNTFQSLKVRVGRVSVGDCVKKRKPLRVNLILLAQPERNRTPGLRSSKVFSLLPLLQSPSAGITWWSNLRACLPSNWREERQLLSQQILAKHSCRDLVVVSSFPSLIHSLSCHPVAHFNLLSVTGRTAIMGSLFSKLRVRKSWSN